MDNAVQEGQILAGKYRVDRVLGVGGMGVVVAAHHIELDDRVAIKFLLPETLGNAEAVARFAREARAAVKIKSEHVARVSDVGKLDNGAPYMVMEYLKGSDLSGWLSEHGPLPVDQTLDFTLQASEAIAEAHSLGIVHRDLKPANLFVIKRPDGGLAIKVLDFGISKTTSLTGSGGEGSMTKTSTMLGSPLYMSPEQIRSAKDVDARCDVWALGVIMYELLTGNAPFGGEHMAELIFKIVSQPAPVLRGVRADVPEGLERVILRCLEKNRDDRFGSIAEMASALSPFAPQRSRISVERISGLTTGAYPPRAPATVVIQAPVVAAQSTDAPARSAGTHASWGSTAVEKRRSVWRLIGAAAAISLAGGLALRLLTATSAATGAARAAPPTASSLLPEPAAHTTQAAAAPEPAAMPAAAPVSTPSSPGTASAGSPTAPIASAPFKAAAPLARASLAAKPRALPVKKATDPSDPWGTGQH